MWPTSAFPGLLPGHRGLMRYKLNMVLWLTAGFTQERLNHLLSLALDPVGPTPTSWAVCGYEPDCPGSFAAW